MKEMRKIEEVKMKKKELMQSLRFGYTCKCLYAAPAPPNSLMNRPLNHVYLFCAAKYNAVHSFHLPRTYNEY